MKFQENSREILLEITRHHKVKKHQMGTEIITSISHKRKKGEKRKFGFIQYLCFLYFRFSLAFKDLGTIDGNETFITGSSIHDGFNIGIGVYGTSNLTITDNVVHFTVGPCIDLQGENNKLVHNLASRSVAESTYKVTEST